MNHVKAALDSTGGNERDRQVAQIHATLAVAHQLRIANLLAYSAQYRERYSIWPTATHDEIAVALDQRVPIS